MKTVIEILNSIPLIDEDGDLNIYDLPDFVTNWPEVSEEDSEDEGEFENESLDLENWEIISLNENKMVMCGGGDWQEPLTFTLVPEGDSLKAIDIHEGFEQGLNEREVIEILSK